MKMVSLSDNLVTMSAQQEEPIIYLQSNSEKQDDDTKRTTPLCEDETSVSISVADDEDTEISSLGGLEEGFDIDDSIADLEQATKRDEDDDNSAATPQQGARPCILKVRPPTPELPQEPRPSFNAFLKKRASTLEKNMDYVRGSVLKRVPSAERLGEMLSGDSERSFLRERSSTFTRNVQYIAAGGLVQEDAYEEEEEEISVSSFIHARARIFTRNLGTLGSVLNLTSK